MSARIVFRCDGSPTLGAGHVVRCLAIAQALREAGAESIFVLRDLGGDFVGLIEGSGFAATVLGKGAVSELEDAAQTCATVSAVDWIVVDNYALARDWESALRAKAPSIAAIADRDSRLHNVDLLVDPNLGAAPTDYAGRVPLHCATLTGPAYAPLRTQFAAIRKANLVRRSGLRRLLICMGGADPANATAMALEGTLRALAVKSDFTVEVVLGRANPHLASIQNRCAGHKGVEVTVAPDNMARRMANADLFVGSCGSMSWERAALGLPGVTVAVAANQVPLGEALAKAGADLYLGTIETLRAEDFSAAISTFAHTPALLEGLSARIAPICDGGGAARIATALLT